MVKVGWIDVECTGLDPKLNDIIQLSVLIEKDGLVVDSKNITMQPRRWDTIEKEALEVVGVTIDDIKKYQKPQDAFNELKAFLSKHIDKYDKRDKLFPAGYNVRFDIDFLNQFFIKSGDKYFGSFFNWRFLDVMQRVYYLLYLEVIGAIPENKYRLGTLDNLKLETLCDAYGIKIQAHDAMSDVTATRELFCKLTEDDVSNILPTAVDDTDQPKLF